MRSFIQKALLISLPVLMAPAIAADEVSLVMDGIWGNETQITGNGFGYKAWNVWLDVKVENIAYDKVVGIVWTDDDWQSQQVSYLTYEATYPDNSEQWGVDITPIGQFEYTRYSNSAWTNAVTGATTADVDVVTIEYAIFYEVEGATYWDNNEGENYQISIDSVSYNN